jgi:hypothetical protein
MSATAASHLPTLMVGTALAMSVYYFEYGSGIENGEADSSNPATLVARVLAVTVILWGLRPIRLQWNSTMLYAAIVTLALISFLAAWADYGFANDTFFLNTALQLPVLLALNGTPQKVNYARWFRFLAWFVALQAAIDVVVVLTGSALWVYGAFVGGVGNPSSFGLICAILCAFCLLHPKAGKAGGFLAVVLAGAAVMTKSLFAILSIFFLTLIWSSRSLRRFVAVLSVTIIVAGAVSYFALEVLDDTGPGFVQNKLQAAGAVLGFVASDSSSASVFGRLEIHQHTYSALRDQPWRLFIGHFEAKVYWPMDSQVLTYLGSFGLIVLLGFLVSHAYWIYRAWQVRDFDGSFSYIAMLMFGLIFLTNRILDYFPIAILYFVCVVSAIRMPIEGKAVSK